MSLSTERVSKGHSEMFDASTLSAWNLCSSIRSSIFEKGVFHLLLLGTRRFVLRFKHSPVYASQGEEDHRHAKLHYRKIDVYRDDVSRD